MLTDTLPDVERVRLERLRRMSPEERLLEGARLCREARAIQRAGIRHRHPEYDDEQVERAFMRLLWGTELYRRARPDWPLLEP